MWGTGGRAAVLIGGTALGMGGWGAVLPYLYADIATARGLGALAAAGTFTAFALGSLAASPVAGRLADRCPPAVVAATARVLMAVATVALAVADTVPTAWAAAALTGAAFAGGQPAGQVLLLRWAPVSRRREVFAWQFIANNVGIAAGGLAGGFLVSLTTPGGTRPAYVIAGAATLLSAAVIAISGRGVRRVPVDPGVRVGSGSRAALGRPLILLLAVTLLLTMACYAQLDAGLPAYALGSLHATPRLLGIAVATNCVLVCVLTAPVVRATRRHDSSVLLAACALVWVGCWLLLALPLATAAGTSALMIGGFGGFAVGETVFAPVLSPLAARLAPEGAAGRALAAVTGAQTAAQAIGPVLSSALLALDLPAGFIALQVTCCLAVVPLARRLGRLVRTAPAESAVPVG